MKNAFQEGKILDLKNTSGSAIASGGVLELVGNHFVAVADVAISAVGPFASEGVFDLASTDADVWLQGDTLYYDDGTGLITDVPGVLEKIGYAMEDKAASVGASHLVKLVAKV